MFSSAFIDEIIRSVNAQAKKPGKLVIEDETGIVRLPLAEVLLPLPVGTRVREEYMTGKPEATIIGRKILMTANGTMARYLTQRDGETYEREELPGYIVVIASEPAPVNVAAIHDPLTCPAFANSDAAPVA